MSELEDPFILLEPSCDIHLIAGGEFSNDRRHVPLRVLRGEWNSVEGRHDIQVVTTDLEYDWLGLRGADPASIVRLDPPDASGLRRLIPLAPGKVLLQVRYMDPLRPDTYEYQLARIWVHQWMYGWWFGHERANRTDPNSPPATSVFVDPLLAHTQPTVLGLFGLTDEATADSVVGDITGHGYVTLRSADPTICAVDATYSGRLRGVAVGETEVTGRLVRPFADVPNEQPLAVRVTDPHAAPDNELHPVRVNRDVDARTKLNLVFLAEGFTGPSSPTGAADRERFDKAVIELTDGLFSQVRHQPYKLLSSHFNVWSHYTPSRHRGLTPGPELTRNWVADSGDDEADEVAATRIRFIPERVYPPDGSEPEAYSLQDLLLLVGLPEPDDHRTVEQLRAAWSDDDSLPTLMGYDDDLAKTNVIESWRRLHSRGIAVAIDTAYGLIHGSRWGDRMSVSDERSDMVRQPGAGATEEARAAFARRMHRWFKPPSVVRHLGADPRRCAPEYRRARLRLLVNYVTRLGDPDTRPPYRAIGRLLDPNTPIESSGDERHFNSAGLLCVLINSSRPGGTAEHQVAFRLSLGGKRNLSPSNGSTGGIRFLRHGAHNDYQVKKGLTDTLAHELGHSFYGFGDEYEEERGAASRDAEERDNITHADTVMVQGITEDLEFPTPIDPERIKWASLHRIQQADTVVRRTEFRDAAGPGGSNQIVVTLAKGRAERWQKAREEEELVYLRRLNVETRKHQLPIRREDLYEELTIHSIPDDRTIILFSEDGLAQVSPFPPGSVLYIPKRSRFNGVPLALVHEQVFEYMETRSWNEDDPEFPVGRALTENHHTSEDEDDEDPKHSDKVDKTRDRPPSIPGFVAPCQPHKLIGLYEGGFTSTRRAYRPAGDCKMRASRYEARKHDGEFCFVCKYLQVNLVDPSLHPELDEQYPGLSWFKRLVTAQD
jgi:hypothetical protein